MQINIKAMMTIEQGSPTYLINRIKKVRIWHKRFEHTSNIRVIQTSKLLTGMTNFDKKYDFAKIYSNSKASEPKETFMDVNANSDLADTSTTSRTKIQTIMKVSKISNSDFHKICAPYIGSKQTRVVRQYKPITPAEENLEEVYVNF